MVWLATEHCRRRRLNVDFDMDAHSEQVNTRVIYPVLLCGGSGTRLWPLSRKSYPKQFVPLIGEETLFQASALRLSGKGFARPTVLTSADFRFVVAEQLQQVGINPGSILIEPEARNTAPAVLAAVLYLEKKDPDALMLVAPSDHVIKDAADFRTAVKSGVSAAGSGDLVTFGIKPDRPETGYGYLELDGASENDVVKLRRFVEKPDKVRAEEMVADECFLWNAGIFLFSVKTIRKAFEIHAPELIKPVQNAVAKSQIDLGFVRLDPESWAGATSVSIDYAIMERAENLSVVPYASSWSDLGGWDAVWRASNPDEKGVSTAGHATAIDCSDTLLRAESGKQEIVGIGLENTIAIAMPDAVLIADMRRAQDVRCAVDLLKERGATQATQLPYDYRPWGWYETLSLGPRFQVKRIVVHPGSSLSLQSHVHRAEHWIVVAGTAKVTIGEKVSLVSENQSVYVPLGERHRLENPGKVELHLIEVQTGCYLGEDDIVRYEDVYSRDVAE